MAITKEGQLDLVVNKAKELLVEAKISKRSGISGALNDSMMSLCWVCSGPNNMPY
jgi:hypothetical protein